MGRKLIFWGNQFSNDISFYTMRAGVYNMHNKCVVFCKFSVDVYIMFVGAKLFV